MADGSDSGHFRIAFIGYHAGYGREATRAVPGPDRPGSAWDTEPRAGEAAHEEERAYFQADISWVTLGQGDAPESVAAFAQVAGDVGRARGGCGRSQGGNSSMTAGPSLSLGTFALAKGKRAIIIGDPSVLCPEPVRAGALGTATPPARSERPERTPRRRIVFTYEMASALALSDQGFGRGVFPLRAPAGRESEEALTLYFRIERLP